MRIVERVLLCLALYFFVTVICTAQQKTEVAPKSKVEFTMYTIQKEDTAEGLFGDRWIDVLKFNRIDRNHFCVGRKIKIPLRLDDVKNYSPLPNFYEPAKIYEKYILISLGNQFLGCYEYGQLKMSFPIASGKRGYDTPTGNFKILARHKNHRSSLYKIDGTNTLYPMHWAIKFKIYSNGSLWIHGRDMPGRPASHGCIGLYDEEMQKKYYGKLQEPVLVDIKILYLWLFPGTENEAEFKAVNNGSFIRIVKNLD